MFSLNSQQRLYLYNQPTDMRKGFDGLFALVQGQLQENPLSGDAYLFINRGRNRIKILQWEQGGFVIYYKRLEQGTFKKMSIKTEGSTIISWTELVLLMDGITIEKYRKRKRFSSL